MKQPPHNHDSHGFGPAREGYITTPGNIARTGGPKKVHSVKVHGGMSTLSKSGAVALGGNHKSAIDSLTGQATVPGSIKSTPGYGNAGVQSGHPFAKAPGAKRLAPVRAAFGMRGPRDSNRMAELDRAVFPKGSTDLEELGRAVLAQAIKN